MSKYSTRNIAVSIKNNSVDRVVTDLHMKVVATKTLASIPNEAIIQIYNLNQSSREELFNNVYNFTENVGNTVIEVSYDESLLFKGQLINVNSVFSRSSSEWVTTLYCGDGYNAYRQKATKKYDKGTTRKQIVDDLVSELESAGVAVKGAVEGLTACTDKSILKAILIDGEVMDNIKKLLKDCFKDVDVYIDDEKLNALANNSTIQNNTIVINSGLMEPPTLSEQGVSCKVTIDPSIKIGAQIQIDAKSQNVSMGNLTVNRPQKSRISGEGIYRVQEVKHIFDNFSKTVAETQIVGLNAGVS